MGVSKPNKCLKKNGGPKSWKISKGDKQFLRLKTPTMTRLKTKTKWSYIGKDKAAFLSQYPYGKKKKKKKIQLQYYDGFLHTVEGIYAYQNN